MRVDAAGGIVVGLGVYLALGAAFAVAFAIAGVQRIDPAARGAGWGFRLIILPGAAALWPLLLRRWLSGDTAPPRERNAHRDAAAAAPRADDAATRADDEVAPRHESRPP
jgi:hypothetical protein